MLLRPLRALAIGAAVVALPLAAAMPGCGSDAVGVADCRQIETARCQLAPACASYAMKQGGGLPIVSTPADVTSCVNFYRDQCLNGIENADGGTSTLQDTACVNALTATAACAGAATIEGCKGAEVVAPTDAGPCTILLSQPEQLTACNWIATPPGTTSTSGAGGAGGAQTATVTSSSSASGAGGN